MKNAAFLVDLEKVDQMRAGSLFNLLAFAFAFHHLFVRVGPDEEAGFCARRVLELIERVVGPITLDNGLNHVEINL